MTVANGSFKFVVSHVAHTPRHLRTPTEQASLEAAERVRAVAAGLRSPDCACCDELVQQMRAAAELLEEVVGCG